MAHGPLTKADMPLKIISNIRFNGQKRKIEANPGVAVMKRNLKFKGLSVTSLKDRGIPQLKGFKVFTTSMRVLQVYFTSYYNMYSSTK